MKERFGQFQMARHNCSVKLAARSAFRTMDTPPAGASDAAHTAERFFGWFDRQLTRLNPTPHTPPAPQPNDHNHNLVRER